MAATRVRADGHPGEDRAMAASSIDGGRKDSQAGRTVGRAGATRQQEQQGQRNQQGQQGQQGQRNQRRQPQGQLGPQDEQRQGEQGEQAQEQLQQALRDPQRSSRPPATGGGRGGQPPLEEDQARGFEDNGAIRSMPALVAGSGRKAP